VLFATALTLVQGDGDSGDSGEEEEGQGYGDGEDDGMGFFNYNDEFDFSEYAIYPLSCITDSDGSNVVFELYGEGHNQCSKKSVGTYKTSVQYFVTAYVKQKQQEAEMSGGDYEVDEEAIGYLYCTQFVYNNNYFFVQLGCREGTGKGFQIHSYSDQYCTEKMESQNYNLGIDTSSIMVGFEYCKNCQYQSQYANNNNNNNNNNNMNVATSLVIMYVSFIQFVSGKGLDDTMWRKGALRKAVREHCNHRYSNSDEEKSNSNTEEYGPIEDWDVSGVKNMRFLFAKQKSCNPDISQWNVSAVENFEGMFSGASAFNVDLSKWNVENGVKFNFMFKDTRAFNQDLNGWKVGKGQQFLKMFGSSVFNQDLSEWDVRAGVDFTAMFGYATAFNQDLSKWNVGDDATVHHMFYKSGMTLSAGEWAEGFEVDVSEVYVDGAPMGTKCTTN